jgi:DNA-binding transcriptional LysR family regulator
MDLPRSPVSKLVQDLEALRLLADPDEMDGTVAGARSTPKGRLRVNIGSVMANRILIRHLPEFQSLVPDIDHVLGVSDRSADLVGEGIDCVIPGGLLPDSSMEAHKLRELDFVVWAAPISQASTCPRIRTTSSILPATTRRNNRVWTKRM